MCQNCDTPENRQRLDETLEFVGGVDAEQKMVLDRILFESTETGNDKFLDDSPYGSVPLTVGMVNILHSALKGEIDNFLAQADEIRQMPDFLRALMGVDEERIAEGKKVWLATLDTFAAIKAGNVETAMAEVVVPDDISALVGDSDGSTS